MVAKKKKSKVKVLLPNMIPVDQLIFDESNPNKQDKKTFELLVANIKEVGFDENAIAITTDKFTEDGRPMYKLVAGNHKVMAAMRNDVDEVPVVIRDDWDKYTVMSQAYRRNFSRGEVDRLVYTNIVNQLREEEGLNDHEVMRKLGIHDEEKFQSQLAQEVDEEYKGTSGSGSGGLDDSAEEELNNRIKLIDNIGLVVSEIVEKYGDTIPFSLLIFPTSGRKHAYIQSTPALKAVLTKVFQECVQKGHDVSSTLAGLINVGVAQTNFAANQVVEEFGDDFTEITIEDLQS
jgi:hypothetical protein